MVPKATEGRKNDRLVNKNIEDVSIIRQKRKGKTLVQNLFEKLTSEYGDFPDEKQMINELLKIDDVDFDPLLEQI